MVNLIVAIKWCLSLTFVPPRIKYNGNYQKYNDKIDKWDFAHSSILLIQYGREYIYILNKSLFFLYYWICVCFIGAFIGIFVAIIYNVSRLGDSLYTPLVIFPESFPFINENNNWNRHLVIDDFTYISKYLNYINYYAHFIVSRYETYPIRSVSPILKMSLDQFVIAHIFEIVVPLHRVA